RAGEVPDAGAVDDAARFAEVLEAAVLLQVKLQRLPVLAVGLAVGVVRHGVGCGVLLGREALFRVALLKLYHVHAADVRGDEHHPAGRLRLAPVVAANLSDDARPLQRSPSWT